MGIHRYKKHKITKHRTLSVPEGFEFITVERDPHQKRMIRIIFKKK